MKTKLTLLFLLISIFSFSQKVCNDFYYKKFTKKQLTEDVDFVKEKILNAHANPFTEISRTEFDKKVIDIKSSLKDGMTQREFYYVVKPLIVTLNDEHSGISDYCVTDSIKNNNKALPLRFEYDNGRMILTENYSNNSDLMIGDELISLNNIPISEILKNCAETIPGAKEERISMAVAKFWIVISKFCYFIKDDFNLVFKSGKKFLLKSLPLKEISKNALKTQQEKKNILLIEYNKIKDIGYLSVNSFNDKTISKVQYDSIFALIKKQNVKKIVIDVSNNSGGNSALGDLLITYFSDKPYKTYYGTWKKSQEYSTFIKSFGYVYPEYEKVKNGESLPMVSQTITPSYNPLKFSGETILLVGENTFSSAMMFGVTILDNKLAKVVGEIPKRGHPNHFGEIIKFTTPNTNLDFIFGVKEWIRPAGKIEPNKLIPEKIIKLKDKTKEEIIDQL